MLYRASDQPLIVLRYDSFWEGVWNVKVPSIFPIGVGSTIFPLAFPDTKIGSPLLKTIDLRSSSLVPPGFMRILCVDKICPATLPLTFPATVMSSLAPCGLNSVILTELVFSFPSKSSSFSKIRSHLIAGQKQTS
jgi:hypothetical protein